MSESLGDALSAEQTRVRELLASYKEQGPIGVLSAAYIYESLYIADMAIISGDVIGMTAAYKDLKEIN